MNRDTVITLVARLSEDICCSVNVVSVKWLALPPMFVLHFMWDCVFAWGSEGVNMKRLCTLILLKLFDFFFQTNMASFSLLGYLNIVIYTVKRYSWKQCLPMNHIVEP